MFGPFIGAIPSLLLVVIQSPLHALYLLIFIIVLQQVDGNIIGPKILGNSTGLSAFWVMFSILIGGGLFGFLGMLLGVPVFAMIYYIIRRLVNLSLIHILAKVNDAIGMHFFCQFYDHICFFFVGTVIEIV